jgi:RNase P/RNase MRP subunit POP5
MVVKSKRGRRRYIAVRALAEHSMTDEDLLSSLNISLTRSGVKFKVIQFDGHLGIIRVAGPDQHRATAAINGQAERSLETLRASGTLRSLREGALGPKKR